MATYTWPTTKAFFPERFEVEPRTNVLVSPSPFTGGVQTVELPGMRWVFALAMDAAPLDEQAEREAFLTKVGGQANRVSLWHQIRPAPRGTLRGARTLTGVVAAGATSATISATSGNTLLKGDMLLIGGELKQVVEDATAVGSSITVQFRPAMRVQAASGSSVVWDKPAVPFILTGPARVPYSPTRGEAFMLEFVEAFQ